MNDRQKKRLAGEKLSQAGDLLRDALQALESCETLTLTRHMGEKLEAIQGICWKLAGNLYANSTMFSEEEFQGWLNQDTKHHCCTADGSCHTGQHVSGKCGPGCSQWEGEK